LKYKSLFYAYLYCLLTSIILFANPAQAQYGLNVWDVLRKEFRLNHAITQAEVHSQLQWLIAHPSYLHKLAQSEPYIYHIVTQIKKRGLPGELALIPMIESAYDPFAYSGVGAAGLWQLMPGTGTTLGLKSDWWYDGRRSIGSSTDAALNYLSYLNGYFNGDWLLAIAAYDSGEGTIARIIKANPGIRGEVNFFNLPVPAETQAYVPRLLALAEIIQNPQRYHLELPDIPHEPYFEEVNIGSPIDLNHAAKLAGITYKELIRLNPGFNRWATPPYRPYKLLIPTDKVDSFNRNLANLPIDKRVNWTTHQVSAGDNLVIIAQKYHTTVNLIKELNQLKSNEVKKGQYVLIPNTKNTPPMAKGVEKKESHFITNKQYKVVHIVQKSDSFAKLQTKYSVSGQDIRKWNSIPANLAIKPGQQLIIWKTTNPSGIYTVKPGDTLSTIAKLYNTKTRNLVYLNPQLKGHFLKPGEKLKIG
jgi:membrane-bound lytic murein transglycosylase D